MRFQYPIAEKAFVSACDHLCVSYRLRYSELAGLFLGEGVENESEKEIFINGCREYSLMGRE